MKLIRVRAHGGPEVLRVEDEPLPEPGPGQVRVRVRAVGLNHLDLWVRRGVPGHRFPLPLVPGSDVAGLTDDGRRVALHPATSCGRCAACSEGRENLCRDYRIRGEGQDGGMREALVCDASDLLPIPDAMSFEEAASLPLAALTAWHMLHVRARVRAGETVLVLAGTSGVGAMTVQLARAAGCRVVATAGTAEKRAKCLELGADEALDHGEDFRLKADVVVEHVGAATWERSLKCLGWGGRLVTCGATTGAEVRIDLRALFFKQQSILGSTMGTRADMAAAWAEVMARRLRPVVGFVGAMSRLGEAHGELEAGRVVGKAVVRQDL